MKLLIYCNHLVKFNEEMDIEEFENHYDFSIVASIKKKSLN